MGPFSPPAAFCISPCHVFCSLHSIHDKIQVSNKIKIKGKRKLTYGPNDTSDVIVWAHFRRRCHRLPSLFLSRNGGEGRGYVEVVFGCVEVVVSEFEIVVQNYSKFISNSESHDSVFVMLKEIISNS